jgi:hypothetical protein
VEDAHNSFTQALLAHEGPRLRAAFEACRASGSHNYDRTTLNRWLTGSVPTNGEAIRCLSEQLDDPAVIDTWHEQRNQQPPKGQPTVDTVVRRFGLLNEKDQEKAFQRIRQTYLGRFTSVRREFLNRVEVLDPFGDDEDHFILSVTVGWKGRILTDSTAILATDQTSLGNAYAETSCIFREKIELGESTISHLLQSCDPPSLSVIPLASSNPQPEMFIGQWDGLTARFGNDVTDDAEIQVNVQFPVSRSTLLYPVNFGQYRVEGGASLTLVLTSKALKDPHALPFLPPGKERDVAMVHPRPNTLEVRLGTHPDTVLSQGDGAVLGWGIA